MPVSVPTNTAAASTQPGYTPYDPTQSALTNAQNMVNNQNSNYNTFMSNMPQYQNNVANQAIDQGYQSYNNQKNSIDTSANQRGLLYSGLKQGAETSAANTAANQTQNQIAQGNAGLMNYASGYGNQVAGSNIANYGSNVSSALSQYQQGMANSAQQNQLTGSLLSGGMALGGMALFSDEKLKDDVRDADDDASDMVDKLNAKRYSYKDDPEKKEHLGILAQDLEKSPMGKAMVIETPKGKAVDTAKALAAVLALHSVMDKRLKKVGA